MNWLRSALKLGICILQFGLTAAIGGCAPMQFAKDGAGEEQLKQDSYVCDQEWERSPKTIVYKRDPFMNAYYRFSAGGRLQECLEHKGWRRTDGEVQAKKPDADTGQNQPRGQTAAEATAAPSTRGTLHPGVDATVASSNRGMLGVTSADSFEDAVSAYDRGDYTRAARLFRSFAEQGKARAQFYLATMYDDGRGVPQDFTRAYMWLNVASAALSGDEGKAAMKNRYHVVSQMTAAQIEKAQEMARRCQQSQFKECD